MSSVLFSVSSPPSFEGRLLTSESPRSSICASTSTSTHSANESNSRPQSPAPLAQLPSFNIALATSPEYGSSPSVSGNSSVPGPPQRPAWSSTAPGLSISQILAAASEFKRMQENENRSTALFHLSVAVGPKALTAASAQPSERPLSPIPESVVGASARAVDCFFATSRKSISTSSEYSFTGSEYSSTGSEYSTASFEWVGSRRASLTPSELVARPRLPSIPEVVEISLTSASAKDAQRAGLKPSSLPESPSDVAHQEFTPSSTPSPAQAKSNQQSRFRPRIPSVVRGLFNRRENATRAAEARSQAVCAEERASRRVLQPVHQSGQQSQQSGEVLHTSNATRLAAQSLLHEERKRLKKQQKKAHRRGEVLRPKEITPVLRRIYLFAEEPLPESGVLEVRPRKNKSEASGGEQWYKFF